jgi:hypothetical protein
MISETFSPKDLAQTGIFSQNTASLLYLSLHRLLRKGPIFRRKLAKIAENIDHNIDPLNSGR